MTAKESQHLSESWCFCAIFTWIAKCVLAALFILTQWGRYYPPPKDTGGDFPAFQEKAKGWEVFYRAMGRAGVRAPCKIPVMVLSLAHISSIYTTISVHLPFFHPQQICTEHSWVPATMLGQVLDLVSMFQEPGVWWLPRHNLVHEWCRRQQDAVTAQGKTPAPGRMSELRPEGCVGSSKGKQRES